MDNFIYMFYGVYICVVLSLINKRLRITGCVCAVLPPRQDLGNRAGGTGWAKMVFWPRDAGWGLIKVRKIYVAIEKLNLD